VQKSELNKELGRNRGLLLSIGLFSIFVNLLMLTGPIFMLQVYDRVLGSGSEETLLALFLLMVALYAIMGVLDYIRGRVSARIGANFQAGLDNRVFGAQINRSLQTSSQTSSLADLETIQKFFSSPVIFAFFDIPWTPIFVAAIFIFHPWLGWVAVAGASILIMVTMFNQLLTKRVVLEANQASAHGNAFSEDIRIHRELVRGLGMMDAALRKWQDVRENALARQILSSDRTGGFAAFSKSFRFFLQSTMLALGAYLTLQGEITAGAMIAASIMLGRALTPIEQVIGQWPVVLRTRQGWNSLNELLKAVPAMPTLTKLPRPRAMLEVERASVIPPGAKEPTLKAVSFKLQPGQVLGVIGQSASGKSSLARILTGIWRPVSGKVRLDGATLDQFETDSLGQHIGYLPQDVTLFSATIADNIARLSPDAKSEDIVAAAKMAGAHEMILQLVDGYNTMVNAQGGTLSGGQKQRIGLARAMFLEPVILVLDEPNSNLDSPGTLALNTAIRSIKSAGGSVIIMAHRPAALAECDLVLILEHGAMKAFGPRDDVLKSQVKNYKQVAGQMQPKAET